jgi:hypothetical protein
LENSGRCQPGQVAQVGLSGEASAKPGERRSFSAEGCGCAGLFCIVGKDTPQWRKLIKRNNVKMADLGKLQ